MRISLLFLQSRHAGWAALYLAGIAAFMAALVVLIRETSEGGRDPFTNSFDGSASPFVLVFLPLASALVIGVATHGPFGELERTASRPLPVLRLGHLALLLLWGAVTLLLISLAWNPDAGWVFLRNLAGFAGLAFLSAPLTGGRLSWVLPFPYAMLALWIGGSGSAATALVWPLQPLTNGVALATALALLAAGLIATVVFGSRDAKGESE